MKNSRPSWRGHSCLRLAPCLLRLLARRFSTLSASATVGRTPWSAADALVGLSPSGGTFIALADCGSRGTRADQGSAPQKGRLAILSDTNNPVSDWGTAPSQQSPCPARRGSPARILGRPEADRGGPHRDQQQAPRYRPRRARIDHSYSLLGLPLPRTPTWNSGSCSSRFETETGPNCPVCNKSLGVAAPVFEEAVL
jgi:hypothetical protein